MSTQLRIIGSPAGLAAPSPEALGAVLDRVAYASLCVFIFAFPWEETVPLYGGVALSRWFGILAFGMGLARVAAWSQMRRFRELHVWMLAFAGWSSISVLWTLDPDSTTTRALTYLQVLLLAWLIWLLVDSEARVRGLFQSYVLGAGVCAIATILNLLTGHGYSLEDADTQVIHSDRYSANGLNPNDLGWMLGLSIPMIVYLLMRRKQNPAVALFHWAQAVLCVIALLLSGSRGALLASFAALLIFPLTFSQFPRWQKVVAIIAAVGAVTCAIVLVPADTWQRFFDIGTQISKGTMTHRTQIWAASIEVFRNHAFLGVGAAAHPAAVGGIIGRSLVAHNTYLSVLVELGVPGELLFFGLLAAAFSCAWHMRGPERIFWIVLLVTWCIGVSDGTRESRKLTWFLLSTLVAHACVQRKSHTRSRFHDELLRPLSATNPGFNLDPVAVAASETLGPKI